MVGRSVLAGTVVGAATCLLWPLQHWGHSLIAGLRVRPNQGNWDILLGARATLAEVTECLLEGTMEALFTAFVLVVARLLIRRTTIAVAVGTGICVLMGGHLTAASPSHAALRIGISTAVVGILVAVILRLGLLAGIVTAVVSELNVLAWSADWSAWHAQPALLTSAIVAAVAMYGYWVASSGRSFLGEDRVGAPTATG